MNYLGWSEGFHDAAATIINDKGDIVFASHSERFSGNKHEKNISIELKTHIDYHYDIDHYAFFEKPLLKKSRQLYAGQYKTVFNKRQLAWAPNTTFHHHMSHAAATFQTSPYDEASAVVIDSIGEWDCTSIWHCSYDKNGKAVYKKKWSEKYPNSIGLWYTALTHFVGLRPLDEEYIFMGMAAFGKLEVALIEKLEVLFDHNLHKGIPETLIDELGLKYYKDVDVAYNAQIVLEDRLKDIFDKALSYSKNVVYGGGVALNCVANTKLHNQCEGNLWVFPNPGDAGGSLGAAALAYGKQINWEHPYLGHKMEQTQYRNTEEMGQQIVAYLLKNKICGIAHGAAEFGPRALGNRSLIADPRGKDIKDRVNEIKKRQKFRPFAPCVLEERVDEWFNPGIITPYMQHVVQARTNTQKQLPAVIHKDGSCRVQTIHKDEPTIFRRVIEIFHQKTGVPVLLNTSLNIRGEPMVNGINDAVRFEEKYGVKVFY